MIDRAIGRLIDELAADAPTEVADELEALAEELRAAESIEEALQLLGDAREELLAALDPGALAKKTALAGLEQSLAADPLAPGENAADQLEALACPRGRRRRTPDRCQRSECP